MGARPTSRHEAWIAARMEEYQSSSSSGRGPRPEEFVAALDGEESARAALLARLRLLGRLEGGFRALRGETIGVGTELEDFEVQSEIGAGGMGRVFRARQKSVARLVALKVPHAGAALEPAARQRFRREAEAVAQLRHPGIVPLLQVGEHAGTPFLVLELSEGRSLAAVLDELARGRAPRTGAALGRPAESHVRASAQVLLAVLEALDAAHAAGIVHRDVKPGNVLLEPDGRVRVVDFGLARQRDQDSLTESRALVGTVSTMAPEVVRNPHAAGPWSDVYSAGVVLYQLLALRRPFEGRTVLETLHAIEHGELRPLALSHGIPRPLSAIVEKAMARELGRRYAGAAEFASDLRAFLEGREVRARPSTPFARLGRRLQRRPALSALSVALALVLTLLIGVWRSRGEVRSALRRSEAETLTREALLWAFADDEPGGGPAIQTAGRARANDDLERALTLEPGLIEARVELAQYAALRGEAARAHALVEALERDGLRLRALAWTRAWLANPGRKVLRPEPGEELDLTRVHELDRLAWARYLLGEAQNERAREVLRALETHRILGPVANYLQFQCCYTRGRRDPTRATGHLRAALAIVPEHPILLANLAVVFGERWAALTGPLSEVERQSKENLAADAAALFPRLTAAEADAPRLHALWQSHWSLLGNLGQVDEAEALVRRGLAVLPGDARLTHCFAQSLFMRWHPLLAHGEPLPPGELEELRARLELALRHDPDRAELLFLMTYAHYHREDPEATLAWGERACSALERGPAAPDTEGKRENLVEMMAWARATLEETLAR